MNKKLDNYICIFLYHRKAQMYQTISIHLIRKSNSQTNDDKIIITPSLSRSTEINETSMVYNVALSIPPDHSNSYLPYKANMTLESSKSLQTYIRTLLHLLKADNEPYKSIQFDLPMIPSILVSQKDLSTLEYDIYHYLDLLVNSWPTTPASVAPNAPVKPRRSSRHLFFDDDDFPVPCKNMGYSCHY